MKKVTPIQLGIVATRPKPAPHRISRRIRRLEKQLVYFWTDKTVFTRQMATDAWIGAGFAVLTALGMLGCVLLHLVHHGRL